MIPLCLTTCRDKPRPVPTGRDKARPSSSAAKPQIKSHDPPPRTVNHLRSNYSIRYLGADPKHRHTRSSALWSITVR